MPPVIAAAAPYITAYIAKFSLVKFLVSTAISMALNAAGSAFFGKKPKSQDNSNAFARGIQDVIRSSVAEHRLVYGEFRVGGVLFFAGTGGSNNKYLHLAIVVAAHEIDSFVDVYLDNEKIGDLDDDGWVQSGTYSGKVRVKFHLGSPDQLADPDMVSEIEEWTEDHRARGRAYVYFKFVYDSKTFPTGIPNVGLLIRGKSDIYDPRSGQSGWSDNWALCVYDFMKSDYAVQLHDDDFDDANIIAQANICEELVQVTSTETQDRYNLNGIVFTGDHPIETLDNMMTAAAAVPVWTTGKYFLYVGAYRAPTLTLTRSDFIGDFVVSPHLPRKEKFNRIKGVYHNPDDDYQPTEFPPVENILYEMQDGNEQITHEIELPFTTNKTRAQRIAKIHLERARQGMTITATVNLKAIPLSVAGTVSLVIPEIGADEKEFICTKWVESERGVDVILQEEAAQSYEWNFGDATLIDPAPNTNFPDPRKVAAPTAVVVSTEEVIDNGTTISRIIIKWAAPDDGFVQEGGHIEIQFRKTNDLIVVWEPSWSVRGDVNQTSTPTVEDGVLYNIRVRSINRLLVDSQWQYVNGYLVGSGEGGTVELLDYGFVEEVVSEFLDYGFVGDAVTTSLDYGLIN